MNFDLNPELIDQIVFAMENQEKDFVFDIEKIEIIPLEDIPEDAADEGRFIPIPDWKSAHGYHLMEKFVSGLKNPLYREALRDILNSGRGVFRQFKNILRDRPEIEHLWRRFKQREMQRIVRNWYNRNREAMNLERVEFDDQDETESLVLSDISLRPAGAQHLNLIRNLDREAFEDIYRMYSKEYRDYFFRRERSGVPPENPEDPLLIIAEIPSGEAAGFIRGIFDEVTAGLKVCRILQLYVVPEFRGLGLAGVLLDRICSAAYRENADSIFIDVPGTCSFMEEHLRARGFTTGSTRMQLDLNIWEEDGSDQ